VSCFKNFCARAFFKSEFSTTDALNSHIASIYRTFFNTVRSVSATLRCNSVNSFALDVSNASIGAGVEVSGAHASANGRSTASCASTRAFAMRSSSRDVRKLSTCRVNASSEASSAASVCASTVDRDEPPPARDKGVCWSVFTIGRRVASVAIGICARESNEFASLVATVPLNDLVLSRCSAARRAQICRS
jgi:hypothetical protein